MEDARAGTIVREYLTRLLVDHDLSVCEEMLAGDYVDHDAPEGTPPGPEATRRYAEVMLRDCPDLTVRLHDLVADGHRVAVRAEWLGTDRDTGRRTSTSGLLVIHLNADGRLRERWSAYGPPQPSAGV